MVDVLNPGGPAVPPPGGPYVPPPAAGEPNPNPTPAPVQTPPVEPPPPAPKLPTPTPPAPLEPIKTPAPPPSPATPPGTDESLLGNLDDIKAPPIPAIKPTVESLKIPEGVPYPKEFLAEIAKESPTVEDAQARFDTAHKLFTLMQSGAKAKNLEWIQGLKKDAEVGGQAFEASVKLYKQGVVEEFGKQFAISLSKSLLDAEPNFFKAVVRRMRAKNPSPRVDGTPIPKEEPVADMHDLAKRIYKDMSAQTPVPARTSPTF